MLKTTNQRVLITATVAAAMCAMLAACGGGDDNAPFATALYGDVPYGNDLVEFKKMPAFIASINSDKDLSLALHAGDLHSGSEPCTEAYDQAIAGYFKQFTVPLVYTPGDNEWADCHLTKQKTGKYTATDPLLGYPLNTVIPSYKDGNPVENLKLIRSLFFPTAGKTLGSGALTVHSQASEGTTATDKNYVENVWWMKQDVLFATVNIPGGSNNGTDVWFADKKPDTPQPGTAEQSAEVANRTAATKAWLRNAFDQADAQHANYVVLMMQADMWSSEAKAADPRLSEYKQYIDIIADRTTRFGKPVLLINGDTHLFQSDNPLLKGAPCVKEAALSSGTAITATDCDFEPYDKQTGTYAVKNFHRVVVHGQNQPMEWTKLTFDPSKNAPNGRYAYGPFSWERKFVN